MPPSLPFCRGKPDTSDGKGSSEHPIGELRQAIDLDKDIRLVALDDEDFYVWDWIGGLK